MNDEIDLLVERFLAGAATPSEVARLEELLGKDPAAFRRFIQDLDQDVSLRGLLAWDEARKPAGTPEATEIPTPERSAERPRRRLFATTRPGSSFGFSEGAVAAAAVLAGVILFLSLSGSGPRREAPGDARRRDRSWAEKREEARLRLEASARERQNAQAKLDELDRERERIRPLQSPAPRDPESQKKQAEDLERLKARRQEAESEMQLAVEREARARETFEHSETGPPDAAPPVPPGAEKPVGVTVAREASRVPTVTLEAVQGEAFVLSEAGASPARAGLVLFGGQGLETRGSDARIAARFADGTRLEVGPRTVVREIHELEPPGKGARGRRLHLAQGTLGAEVKRQPADQPLLVATPHAQAKVLGTVLRLGVEPGEKGQTRLFVREGKVRLTRSDGKSVDVGAGFEALAAVGTEFVARPQEIPRGGMALWFRSDQGVAQTGGAVSLWMDRSGNNRHAAQPVAVYQPILVRNSVGGHPALRFDGIDDHLVFPCPVTGLPGMTIFLVSSSFEDRTGGVNGSGNAALFWHEAENFGTVVLTPSSSKVRFFFGTGQNQAVFAFARPSPLDRAWSLSTAVKNGAEAILYVNGRESLRVGAQRPTLAACEKGGSLGRGEGDLLTNRLFQGQYEGWTYFSGEIAEVLVYARALGEEERMAVEDYLLGKYFAK